MTFKRRVFHIGGALSQLLNAALFGGHPNESISGRVYREDRKWAVRLIDTLIFWHPNHCEESFMTDYMWAVELTNTFTATVPNERA